MDPAGATHYEVLGIARGAGAEEIRAAYHRLASQYHPDRHEGNPLADLAEERLAVVNAAYEVLSDPMRRAAYDRELAAGRPPQVVAPARAVPGALKLLLRVVAGFAAVVLLVRLVPVLWRLLEALLAPLAGTPVAPLAALAVVALVVVLVWRRRAGRGQRARKPD
jgi:preprotein translocase subunit Sec63